MIRDKEKKMKKASIFVLVLLMLFCTTVFAEDAKPQAPVQVAAPATTPVVAEVKIANVKKGRCVSCPADKLGRGISNMVLSALEVPLRIGKEMEKTDPTAALVAGTLKGVFWTGARLVVGAFETVTFLIPTKPMISEFDAGWWSA
jgi:putative exosortase-associated protein (TIGR04073 family)